MKKIKILISVIIVVLGIFSLTGYVDEDIGKSIIFACLGIANMFDGIDNYRQGKKVNSIGLFLLSIIVFIFAYSIYPIK